MVIRRISLAIQGKSPCFDANGMDSGLEVAKDLVRHCVFELYSSLYAYGPLRSPITENRVRPVSSFALSSQNDVLLSLKRVWKINGEEAVILR